jgi:NAD(P)H dehydrogenase (quinone)
MEGCGNAATVHFQGASEWPGFSSSTTRHTVTSRRWRKRSRREPEQRARWSTSSACPDGHGRHREGRLFKLDQAASVAKVEELENYDAIIVGAPTRFGRIPSQMAAFLDQAGPLWSRGALNGKVGAAFASSATQHGGQETTLFSIIANLLHFGMTIVGLPYSRQGQMTTAEIVGGAPYGATTIAGGDGSRQPSETELAGARHQGELVAKTAAKLFADTSLGTKH